MNKFWKSVKVEPADQKRRRDVQIKFSTTCNKNEQQQDGKNNAELPLKRLLNEAETGLSRPDW